MPGRPRQQRPATKRSTPKRFFQSLCAISPWLGGPIAHLAYFRTEFVDRRRWLGDAEFAELLALCQFLPGPASSQLGMAIGMRQAGFSGALAAWLGFTLPSALLMFALAMGLLHTSFEKSASVLNALLLVSVAVVAQA
ncbi:MAG: chromate transporter, partial [Betaproteobacteria bacterium]|nr:chromate transporter [Betaproteobacteria bacterium]